MGDYIACVHCLCVRNLATWLPCLPTLLVYHVGWQLGNLEVGALLAYIACVVCTLPTSATWQLGCLACLHCLLGTQVRRLRGGREEVAFLTPRISPVRAN